MTAIIISKIVADPPGFDRALKPDGRRHLGAFINLIDEYVELRNDGDWAIDISHWILKDAKDHQFVIPAATIIQSGETLKIYTGKGTKTSADLYWNRRAPVWNNIIDTAFLIDDKGRLIDQKQFPLLPALQAETNPLGYAIDLIWEIPLIDTNFPDTPDDIMPLTILRRERRFSGKNRRGSMPVAATSQHDGFLVYKTVDFHFDFEESQEEWEGNRQVSTTRQYLYQGEPPSRILVRTIRKESLPNKEGKPVPSRMTARVIDRENLQAGTIYYYTAFVGFKLVFSRLTQASALATGRYGHNLFKALPRIHQQLDTALPDPLKVSRLNDDKGQLQRLLEVFDPHLDMLHGMIDGLHDLHNPQRVDSRLLPHLSKLIGWRLKENLNEEQQRTEIAFAPEVYKIVGTIQNIAWVINRLTGWETEVREFSRNVLRSFDSSRLETLKSGETVYLDGSVNPDDPDWKTHRLPAGSFDTRDPNAIFKMKTTDPMDKTAYSYHVPPLERKQDTFAESNTESPALYNRETIGIYIYPDLGSETFSLEHDVQRLYQSLLEFLPIQVRPIFFLRPTDVEESYDAVRKVIEDGQDTLTAWQVFITNSKDHRSVNTTIHPINTDSRTWWKGAPRKP